MRIAIHTLGTRGDLQPYLALAQALKLRGHTVVLAGPEQFEADASAKGIDYAALPGAFLDLLNSPEGKKAVAGGGGLAPGFKLIGVVTPMMRGLLDRELEVARDFQPELIVYHPKSLAAPHLSEALDIPAVLASPLPGFTPTAAFPSPLLPFSNLGPLNRPSHMLATHGAGVLFGKTMQGWRRDALGMSRGSGRAPVRTLYAYSPQVLPKPADWGDDVVVTGYWFLDEPGWVMPPALNAFLKAGPSPVYVGFGSMPGVEPGALTALVAQALQQAGLRGVLATGGGAMAAQPVGTHVHLIAHAPHDQLFPHMRAALHHGGAGTTGAALRAGLPMAICPYFGDQPFWARRMMELGVAGTPLNRKTLDAQSLAIALGELLAGPAAARAVDLGGRIRHENGLATACAAIEGAA